LRVVQLSVITKYGDGEDDAYSGSCCRYCKDKNKSAPVVLLELFRIIIY